MASWKSAEHLKAWKGHWSLSLTWRILKSYLPCLFLGVWRFLRTTGGVYTQLNSNTMFYWLITVLMMSSGLSQHEHRRYRFFLTESLSFKLWVWGLKDEHTYLESREGLIKAAMKVHYGKCMIQCFSSWTHTTDLKVRISFFSLIIGVALWLWYITATPYISPFK